ncbi:MAG TPA: DUF5723 family protein [Puia sp.]|nr:DUF5723 family protein [Puia sp.]
MKNMLAFAVFLNICVCLHAQQNLGIRNSNYAGVQGALLNPSSLADSKLKLDVNIISGDVVFDNTFLYAPKKSVPLFGFGRIIKGSIDENLFRTHFDPSNPDKLYHLTLSTEILGPSFFMQVAKKHEIGVTMSTRGSADIRGISGNLGQNAFDYFLNKGLWNTDFHDNATRINSMGWLQYGFHYATVLHSEGRSEWKVGVTLNYLVGIAAAYTKNSHINYKITDTSNINFSNTSIDYGRTAIDDFRNARVSHDLDHGHGFGLDVGVTYVRLKEQQTSSTAAKSNLFIPANGNDYLYRIGISLIDFGAIIFDKNSASYHLDAASADFTNWHGSKFSDNTQLDRTLSAVFYNGDSARSLTANHFKMGTPAALSIQADWNVYQHFFANMTIIKGFGHGSGQGAIRPDVYSLTPRYEKEQFEISMPFSLLYYGHLRPRLGLAGRYKYFFIGSDAPGSILKLHDLEGVDFYAGAHFYLATKSKNH